jgi:hypothetical protein
MVVGCISGQVPVLFASQFQHIRSKLCGLNHLWNEQCDLISRFEHDLFMKKITLNEPCLPGRHVGLVTPRLFTGCSIESMLLCTFDHITADPMQKPVNW